MTLQKQIIAELGVQPTINPEEVVVLIVERLKLYVKTNSFLRSLVLGISGGQDSTLVGKLAQMAIDELNEECGHEQYEFIPVRLPYGVQRDEQDAQDAIAFMGAKRIVTINIKDAVDASIATYEAATGEKVTDFIKGNEKARERMKAQYLIGAMHKGIVLGTDHAAEAITGFYTKHGDGAADYAPITFINKRQGKELLKFLGAPEHLYLKKPTADLEENRPSLPDEEALGMTYDEIDDYLEGKVIDKEKQLHLEEIYTRTRHKRFPVITTHDTWWEE